MYLCKSCNHKLADEADFCVNCGDLDPFYEKKLNKIKKEYKRDISNKEKLVKVGGIIFMISLCLSIFAVAISIAGWIITREIKVPLIDFIYLLLILVFGITLSSIYSKKIKIREDLYFKEYIPYDNKRLKLRVDEDK